MLKTLIYTYFFIATGIGVSLFSVIAYHKNSATESYWPIPIAWLILCGAFYLFARFYLLEKTFTGADPDEKDLAEYQRKLFPIIGYGLLVLEPSLGIILALLIIFRVAGYS